MYSYQTCDFLPPVERGGHFELLFYCIGFSLYAGLSPLDRFLRGILTDEDSPAGGDPGWSLNPVKEIEKADFPDQWAECVASSKYPELGCYEAWAYSEISDIHPETASYTMEEVRSYIRLALLNIAKWKPERAKEVERLLLQYNLSDYKSADGRFS
jgi:hypothetical protein